MSCASRPMVSKRRGRRRCRPDAFRRRTGLGLRIASAILDVEARQISLTAGAACRDGQVCGGRRDAGSSPPASRRLSNTGRRSLEMDDGKSWYRSKTIWGGLVALLAALCGLVGSSSTRHRAAR